VLTAAERDALNAALDGLQASYAGQACPESDAEDLHTWIEGTLAETTGDAGRKIHTARSRNDQVATLLTMYVIDAGERLAAQLADFIRTACDRATAWSEFVFPLHTHSQFAAPGSVGFWMLRYAVAMDGARRSLRSSIGQWRQYCPLGSGAVAGSTMPLDRAIQARELGFAEPSRNALESVTTRDACLQWLAVAAQIALQLQSLATDVIMFSQTPLGWTVYPPAFGTGSSMMPNKMNPDAMELLRGACCEVAAAHGQAVLLLKGLPSGYNRDLQCIKPLVHQAVEKLLVLGVMANAFLGELDFDRERLQESLQLGSIDATARMERKVVAGTPLRDAHHVVAEELAAGTAGSADAGSVAAIASAYKTRGSASPAETRRVAAQLFEQLESAS
jgi:argininosuccinate lyase